MKNKYYCLLKDRDLSKTQIYVTVQTYDRFAKKYADRWEWNSKTVREIEKYNIKPFVKYVPRKSKVLIIGSRTGRDYSLLTKKGYRCLGVEPSYGLLTEALKRVPEGLFVRLPFDSLPFMPESFEVVYADALTHVPKNQIEEILKDFRIFLKTKGYLYLSLKIGEGDVIAMNDLGGYRYMTIYQKDKILKMVRQAGFKIVWSEVSSHTEPSLPKWFSLILQKK